MPIRSAAERLLPWPNFGDGNWHRLDELQEYENRLLTLRQKNPTVSDAVRTDTSPVEKLRRDELLPFLNLANHQELPLNTSFRKPIDECGVDIEYVAAGTLTRLQITTAYPLWLDSVGLPLNGGHQQRLKMEKITTNGQLIGCGPFERREDEILNNEGCNSWEEIETSHRLGLINAFQRKALHWDRNLILLVKGVEYFQNILDVQRFHVMVDSAAREAFQREKFPTRFIRVIVVDSGDGFIWSRDSVQPISVS